jgi:hypothetical protein
MEDTKPELNKEDLNYRRRITKVRGGWTKDKIKKELKNKKGVRSDLGFHKEICKYDSPEELESNLFYHGSGGSISDLKPSISLKYSNGFGGGYGEQYYSISLSKSRNISTNFTGNSGSGNVAPVLLKKNAIVKVISDRSDSSELEDLIVDLWAEGVDAVLLGDHEHENSELELAILNPECIVVGKPDYFQVFQKKKMPSFDKEKIEDMWSNAAKNYKELAIKNQEQADANFRAKYGKERSTTSGWSSRQQSLVDYHNYNVVNNKKDTQVEEFLKKAEEKVIKNPIKSKNKKNIN